MKRTILIITLLLAIFAVACTQEPVSCTLDVRECPDGSVVGRTAPGCEFEQCPDIISSPDDGASVMLPEDEETVIVCTAEQKATKMCTLDYTPVCGSDSITYGNKCGACAAGIDSYTEGECISADDIIKY